MSVVATIGQLEAIYGQPNEASTVKIEDRVTPQYRILIEKSPFAVLATCGPISGIPTSGVTPQACRGRARFSPA